MPHFHTLNDFRFKETEEDVRGADIYDVNNDKLGKIDDVVFEHGTGDVKYVVVDTGGLLSHHKFLVPADRVHNYEPDPKAFQVDMLKKHVERFPKFDKSTLSSEDDWRDYERHYNEWVETGDVLHQAGSPNIVTPPAEEIAAEPSITQGGGPAGQGRKLDLTPRKFATGEISAPSAMPMTHEATPESHAVEPRSRESQRERPIGTLPDQEDAPVVNERFARFRETVRSNRSDISGGCPICARERRVA